MMPRMNILLLPDSNFESGFSFLRDKPILLNLMTRNTILEKLFLPVADIFLRTNFISELHNWRNNLHKLNKQQLENLQTERLKNLLKHATTNIPYYKNLSVTLSENPFEDIKQFPILYKSTVKSNYQNLFVGNRSKMIAERSSGSSGIQGEVLMTKKEHTQYQALQTSLWEWNGFTIGSPIMQTGITPYRGFLKTVKDWLFKTQYISAYNISPENAKANLLKAKRNGVAYFGGFAASLNVYAEVALKEGIDIKFKGVMAWGDKLFDSYKTNINKAFGNPIITELYGTAEAFVISSSCKNGKHHIITPQTFIEILDKDGNAVRDGELGFVVVTRLDCFSFPLIRYYLGDLAVKEPADMVCNCGKGYPMLQKIIGRDTDIVETPGGRFLVVQFFVGFLEHFHEIQQFSVIQRGLDGLEIEFIASPTYYEGVLDKINKVMFERAEEVFPVKWTQVDFIHPTASGKPQIIQNFIAKKLSV